MFSEDLARAILAERTRKATIAIRERELTIRPVELSDVDRLDRLSRRLAPRTLFSRFRAARSPVPWPAIAWFTLVDHCRKEVLVAIDGDEIVAVARYDETLCGEGSDTIEAELSVTVDDAWRRRGIGRQLSQRLCILARERGCDAFRVKVSDDDAVALDCVARLAPGVRMRRADGGYEARFPLVPGR
jgi:GNAT superfamily N-acetyltransferase